MDREWTDKRMDDFAGRVDRFEANVGRRFDKVDERFDKVDERFANVDERFDRVEVKMKEGFAAAAVQSHAASEKLDHRMAAMNRTVWAAILAAGVVKLLFG